MELERIVRLRLDVYADHVEACAAVAHRRAASAAEEIEQPGLAHDVPRTCPASQSPDPQRCARYVRVPRAGLCRVCRIEAPRTQEKQPESPDIARVAKPLQDGLCC